MVRKCTRAAVRIALWTASTRQSSSLRGWSTTPQRVRISCSSPWLCHAAGVLPRSAGGCIHKSDPVVRLPESHRRHGASLTASEGAEAGLQAATATAARCTQGTQLRRKGCISLLPLIAIIVCEDCCDQRKDNTRLLFKDSASDDSAAAITQTKFKT